MAFATLGGPTTFVDRALPAISAAELNKLNRIGENLTCLFADLTSGSAATYSGALAFTTDSGGVYLSDGTQWILVAQRSQSVNLTGASSYDFIGLDGEHAGGYIIEFAGRYVLPGSVNKVINVKPNGSSTDTFRTLLTFEATSASNVNSSGLDSADYGGVGAGFTIATSNFNLSGAVAGRAVLHSRTGAYRVCETTQAWTDAAASTARASAQWVSKWENSATAITDLNFDFGGATFTGVLRLTPMVG